MFNRGWYLTNARFEVSNATYKMNPSYEIRYNQDTKKFVGILHDPIDEIMLGVYQ